MQHKITDIEEIAKTMCFQADTCTVKSCVRVNCEKTWLAERLYNAGYRKAEDVARELDDLERYIRLNEDIALKCKEENGEQNREYWKGKLSAFKQIRGYIDAELKKKYIGEDTNVLTNTEDGE